MVHFAFSAAVAMLVASMAFAQDSTACTSAQACQPWIKSMPCAAGNYMDARIVVQQWPASTGNAPTYQTYNYCPIVDETQEYRLHGAGQWAVNALTVPSTNTMIMVYGQGNAGPHQPFPFTFPTKGDTSRTLFTYVFEGTNVNGTGCTTGIAVVDFLMVNFTMTNGLYTYKINGTQSKGPPINSGFVPTCDSNDQCLFGSQACIGVPGRMNCASCYTPAELDQLMVHSVKIWVAYYGTDANGRQFDSGQDNPLNFLQYAQGSAYSALAKNL